MSFKYIASVYLTPKSSGNVTVKGSSYKLLSILLCAYIVKLIYALFSKVLGTVNVIVGYTSYSTSSI